LAEKNGVDKLYWRIEVRDNEKLTDVSETKSFLV